MFVIFERLADLVTFRLLGLADGTKLADAVRFFVEDTTKIFVLLVAVIFLVGLFRRLTTHFRDGFSRAPRDRHCHIGFRCARAARG